jgi:hypothetical protein
MYVQGEVGVTIGNSFPLSYTSLRSGVRGHIECILHSAAREDCQPDDRTVSIIYYSGQIIPTIDSLDTVLRSLRLHDAEQT